MQNTTTELADRCAEAGGWPLPGGGDTYRRWQALAAIASEDLVLGRLVEAHADADAILHEICGRRAATGTRYGVWAAKAPGHELELREGRLYGSKAWCSGATLLTHALVGVEDDLVEVELDQPSVIPGPASWADAGMRGADTRDVSFHGAAIEPIGGDYLGRPGFWSGALGVAACWYGGMVPLVRPLSQRVLERPGDVLAAAHLGAVAVQVGAARAALRDAARLVDSGSVSMALALQVRATVADAAAEVARRVGRALGPAPYAQDALHAQRLADLEVYVRQDHAERDLAVLGAASTEHSWAL